MHFILTKQIQVDAKTMKTLEKVSQLFNFHIIDKSDIVMIKSDGNGDLDCIDYGLIFANQKEEYINRISKQCDLAKVISEKMESNQQQYSHRNENNLVGNESNEMLKGLDKLLQNTNDRFNCSICF